MSATLRLILLPALAALLIACGGGGGDDPPASAAAPSPAIASATPINRLIVFGDSLADVGTFGYRATIQQAGTGAAGYPVYPELVARSLGVTVPCAAFGTADGTRFTTRANCTGYAVGAASIDNPVTRGGDDVPLSVPEQLRTALAAANGGWRAGDLILVDGGGNDLAGLADTWRGAQTSTADRAVLLALLAQELGASEIDDALSQSDGSVVAGQRYMTALAQTFWDALRSNALDKGASRVAVLDLPDISLMPRYRNILASVAAERGTAAATAYQAAIRSWVQAFNAELARRAAGDSRVVIVPFNAEFTNQNSNPSAYGLTNASDAACPDTVDFPQCTDQALDAAPPSGLAPGWWKTWLYSDRFHPSPRGHELLAAVVLRKVQQAGWR